MVEQGNPKATHELACLYLSGLLTVPQLSKGHELLKKAALHYHHPESKYQLGCLIRTYNELFIERQKTAYMLILDAATMGSLSARGYLSEARNNGPTLTSEERSYFWTYKLRHDPGYAFHTKENIPIEGFEHDYLNVEFINQCSLGPPDDICMTGE